jgi:hypothetical protein
MTPTNPLIITLIFLAGIGQMTLAVCSITIPKMLGWKEELQKVNPMVRHIFWTYAGYILITNFSFGLLSFMAPEILVAKTPLSAVVTGYIAAYWLSRITIQFAGFERKNFPKGTMYKLGEILLVSLFAYLTIVYCYAFYFNLVD